MSPKAAPPKLIIGRASEQKFSDESVRRPDVVALRRKVVATVDDGIREESAEVAAHLVGGRSVHVCVEHAIGSLARPMTDADLDAKFHALADPVLRAARAAVDRRLP